MRSLNPLETEWIVNLREKFLYREVLLDLFSIIDFDILELKNPIDIPKNKTRVNKDDITIVRSKDSTVPITFPEKEIELLKTQETIITTRVDNAYNKYKHGDIVKTPWNEDYKVIQVKEYTDIKDHPKKSKLTTEEVTLISKYPKYEVLILRKNKYNRTLDKFAVGWYKDTVVGYYEDKLKNSWLVPLQADNNNALINIYDEFELDNSMIENYTDNTKVKTTVGRFMFNMCILVLPFGEKIKFINKTTNGNVESEVSELYLDGKIDLTKYGPDEITPHDKFMNNYFFLPSISDVIITVFTEHALKTSKEAIRVRDELMTKYKDQLSDPLIGSMIEDACIAEDKKYMKNDASYGFFGSESKKFNVHRKRQYLIGGIQEPFGKDTPGRDFITSSLCEGWKKEEFAMYANDFRNGAYSRGVETAKGGEASAFLLRIFQNTMITTKDCNTTSTLKYFVTSELAKDLIFRYIVENGKLVQLNNDNISKYIGKEINLRSVQYCQAKPGCCTICTGDLYHRLQTKAFGMIALDVGKTIMMASMKAMHGIKLTTMTIVDLDHFMMDVRT